MRRITIGFLVGSSVFSYKPSPISAFIGIDDWNMNFPSKPLCYFQFLPVFRRDGYVIFFRAVRGSGNVVFELSRVGSGRVRK